MTQSSRRTRFTNNTDRVPTESLYYNAAVSIAFSTDVTELQRITRHAVFRVDSDVRAAPQLMIDAD